ATKIIPEELVPVRIVGKLVLNRMVDNFFAETEQVAFCTQNVVPGIDFTNDPLLQGRNFSYLDTQLKRLGSPNFNQLPINAPRCPFHHFQQDGHMAHMNPKGRANYEPNSWSSGGPRADAETGYRHFPEVVEGEKRKARGELFADHYSQARQFYLSQTAIEQDHIIEALVFELSRCEVDAIRQRMVAHLPNIDPDLADIVAAGLGMPAPVAHPPQRAVIDQPVSDALSILKRPPGTFKGRKMGILITDGVDDAALEALVNTLNAEGATPALVGARIGGVVTAGGRSLPVRYSLAATPSVLFDAVAILASEDEAPGLCEDHKALEFVADAYEFRKFIGVNAAARMLLDAADIDADALGVLPLEAEDDGDAFVAACADLRVWDRFE
ncbi:MAG: catalase, partial [Gemmobacter sp.]|nr:catalase [Gemmobacter sp.]